MYVVREVTDMSMSNIGKEFGDRDHSTVVYAINQVVKNCENDAYFKIWWRIFLKLEEYLALPPPFVFHKFCLFNRGVFNFCPGGFFHGYLSTISSPDSLTHFDPKNDGSMPLYRVLPQFHRPYYYCC